MPQQGEQCIPFVFTHSVFITTIALALVLIMYVNDVKKGQIDNTESFWYSEVLKYLCVFSISFVTRRELTNIFLAGTSRSMTRQTSVSMNVSTSSSSIQSTSCSGRRLRHNKRYPSCNL